MQSLRFHHWVARSTPRVIKIVENNPNALKDIVASEFAFGDGVVSVDGVAVVDGAVVAGWIGAPDELAVFDAAVVAGRVVVPDGLAVTDGLAVADGLAVPDGLSVANGFGGPEKIDAIRLHVVRKATSTITFLS